MGQHVILEGQDEARARTFQQALLKDLAAFDYLCENGAMEEAVSRVGAEQEMFLVDRAARPAAVGPEASRRNHRSSGHHGNRTVQP